MELNDYEIANSLNEARSTHLELVENNEFGANYIDRLQAHAEWLESVNQDLSYKVQEAQWKAQQLESDINKILTSITWRVTAPLRSKLIHSTIINYQNKLKTYIKLLLIHTTSYIRRNPRLKYPLLRAIDCFPRMKLRLVRVITSGTEPNLEQLLTATVEQPLTATTEQPLTAIIEQSLAATIERSQPAETDEVNPINYLGHRAKIIYEQLMAANQYSHNKN